MGCLIGFLILGAGGLLATAIPALLPLAVIGALVAWVSWLIGLLRRAAPNPQVGIRPVHPTPSEPAPQSANIRPSGTAPGSAPPTDISHAPGPASYPNWPPSGVSPSASPQALTPVQAGADRTPSGAFLIRESDGACCPVPARTLTFGRSAENDLVFANDPEVSRRHARLVFNGQSLTLTDLGSTNGTMVNGRRLAPQVPVLLNDGDRIAFGHQRLRVELARAQGTQPAQAPVRASVLSTPAPMARDVTTAVPVPAHIPPVPQPIMPPPAPTAVPSAPVATTPEPLPRPKAKPPATRGMRWLGVNQRLEVGAYTIEAPLTYVTTTTRAELDASCINLRLPVGRPVQQAKGALGYWPQYSRISPDQRANYLAWMASGRNAPLADIGYAFLFFYGMERRALVEGQDIPAILAETTRLLSLYPESASFRGYLGSFVAYVLARAGVERLTESDFERILLGVPGILSDSALSVALAWLQHRNQPLPLVLAMEIARRDVRSPRSVVTERLPDQFRALFAAKYAARYGDGVKLKAAANPMRLEYHPASPSLLTMGSYRSSLAPAVLPNVVGFQSQFQPLVSIWSECIEELKPLSRQTAKGVAPHTREAYRALPAALKEGTDHPDKARWDSLVADNVGEDGRVLLPASAVAPLVDVSERPKLTLRQSVDLADTAQEVGFLIVPDPHITGRAYAWDDLICLFRPAGAAALPANGSYRAAASILELGMAMAAADGQVEDAEIAHVARFLEGHFTLTEDEQRYLAAYQAILQHRPPSLARLSRRLQGALTAEQRALVGRFLVGVAATNGVVERQEAAALRVAYNALRLDTAELDALLAELRSEPAAPAPAETSIALNTALLEQILAETEEVSRLLGQAGEEVEELETGTQPPLDTPLVVTHPSGEQPMPARPQAPDPIADKPVVLPLPGVPSQAILALDARYHALLADLLSHEVWDKEEFSTLVRRYGMMPAAALEEINTWSDEHLGDFLIEDGDAYGIRRELLENEP